MLSRSRTFLLSSAALLLGLAASLRAGTFTTYAAWSDVAAKNRGHMYIYTGNFPNHGREPFQRDHHQHVHDGALLQLPGERPWALTSPSSKWAPAVPGDRRLRQQLFKCQSTNPIIWEVEEKHRRQRGGFARLPGRRQFQQ